MKNVNTPWVRFMRRPWALRVIFIFSCITLAPLCKQVLSYTTHEAAESACSDFADDNFAGIAWTLDDCLDIWTAFRENISKQLVIRPPHVDIWKSAADELRRAGTPCLLTSKLNTYSNAYGAGVGSTTMKHFATWIFAKEMGCDWVTPNWVSFTNSKTDEEALYCHFVNEEGKREGTSVRVRVCASVNWLAYFNFGVPSTDLPRGVIMKNVTETNIMGVQNLQSLKAEIKTEGLVNVAWDRLLLIFSSSLVSAHLAAAGSWDKEKNAIARAVLDESRNNFHHHPRPWYNQDLDCGFDSTRLNFAVHVRLGDMLPSFNILKLYLSAVEEFMRTVTAVVVEQGLDPPLFHIFSETIKPCPSKTGVFEEFPAWNIDLDQVESCLSVQIPENCEQNISNQACSPNRSGVFRVHDKLILLHVGRDVLSSLSCMIRSDGVAMGCSTFGQVAGILTNGISFFTVQCGGRHTSPHYQSIPALAVAERGHLWVPVEGKWNEPALKSTDILKRALQRQIDGRDAP